MPEGGSWPDRKYSTSLKRNSLRPRLGLQLHVPAIEFHGKFHIFTAVLLADFCGFFLDEGGKRIEAAGNIFSGFLFGCDQGVVQALDLVALSVFGRVQGE